MDNQERAEKPVRVASELNDQLGSPPIRLKIVRQGPPVVNTDAVWIVKQGDGFIAAEIDMRSKWCVIDSTFCSDGQLGFSISSQERSCHLKEDEDKDGWTEVLLEDFSCKEWDIFTVECSRYTVRLVLVRRDSYRWA